MSAPTEIWWCEEHRASGWGGGRAKWCHLAPATDEKSDNYQCRVVSRRLVDPSALVLLRDEEGQFLDSLLDVLEDMMHTRLIRYGIHERGRCASLAAMAVEVFAERLDALAAASDV